MPAKRKPVAISTMALMSVSTVVSLNALPMMAAEGLSRIHRHVLYGDLGFPGVASAFLVEFSHRTTCPSATPPSMWAWLQADFARFWLCRFLFMLLKTLTEAPGESRKQRLTQRQQWRIEHDCKEYPA